MPMQWFYTENGEQRGPVDEAGLKSRVVQGSLKPDDMVWKEGMVSWVAAKQVKELFPVAPPTPPPVQSQSTPAPPPIATPKQNAFSSLSSNPAVANLLSNPTVARIVDPKNRLLVSYRAALIITVLSVLLPWVRPAIEAPPDEALAAAARGYAPISGINIAWGLLALLVAVGGLIISFLGPPKVFKNYSKQGMCGIGAAIFLLALIDIASPGTHYGGGFFGSLPLAATAAIGAYIALVCGAASGVLGWIKTWEGE